MDDKINIDYDCECSHGMCEHALVEVQRAIQEAYDRGVRDGNLKAVGGLKDMLKREFPKEFTEAQKVLSKRNVKKELSN
jgi:glutamate-1-semialdehyde aminotransferase